MNDDELIHRLRRSLHERADALQPTPGAVPTPEAVEGGPGDRPGWTATVHPAGNDYLHDLDPDARRTAEYTLLPPTGPVPIFGRRNGRRWPPLVGIGALVAAAAAIVAAVLVTGGRHPVTIGPSVSPNPSTTVAPSTPTIGPTPSTTAPRPVTTTTPARPVAVPPSFQPTSVTFVSADDGWALGRVAGASDSCATLARTTDGGYHWVQVTAPPISGSCGSSASGTAPVLSLRFADSQDGWVYTTPGAGVSSRLWSTHDGGTSWTEVALPLTGATIAALEAAGGRVQMVIYGTCSTGPPGCQNQTVEQILTSPVGTDDWTVSAFEPSIGAGPVLAPQLTLWGTTGWIVDTNRTVVSGAQLRGGTQWSDWTPVCSSADGAGLLSAASATDLAAVCAEGVWGTPDLGTTADHNWLFRSSDGGQTFHAVGSIPGNQPLSITSAPGRPETIVVADSQEGLLASYNGGATWTTVEPGLAAGTAAAPGNLFTYVGFTTATQGVAIRTQPTPTLFMTHDGGMTWTPVSF